MAKVILFQGDSITDAGRTYDSDESLGIGYANMVQGQLGMECPGEYTFYNRGINGNRVTDVYARMKRVIISTIKHLLKRILSSVPNRMSFVEYCVRQKHLIK